MNKDQIKIQKISFRSDGGLKISFLEEKKKGKDVIWDENGKNSQLPRHDDLRNFEEELRMHVCKIYGVAGVAGVDVNNLGKGSQKAYDELIESVDMISATFSMKDDGQVYAVILAAKRKVLGNMNINMITGNIQFAATDVYDGAIGLSETCVDLINEAKLYLIEGKSNELNLFTETEEDQNNDSTEETETVPEEEAVEA